MSVSIPNMIEEFLISSKDSIKAVSKAIASSDATHRERVFFHSYGGNSKEEIPFDGSCFFLRTSIEYSSPQLTLEELEGLITARLLEVCVNKRIENDTLDTKDIDEMTEALCRPPNGRVIPFILETDDVEPDRYSNNPLRSSIVESGQSAFPVATTTTDALKLDGLFLDKYEGSLVSKDEVELVKNSLGITHRYVDFVDHVKAEELSRISERYGLELRLPQFRMPLEVLMNERRQDPLHRLISSSHSNYDTIESLYTLMGRSIKKKTSLLTVPHSSKGYGSKRAARGRLYFSDNHLERMSIQYVTTYLYPNMIDYKDLSVAKCDDSFELDGNRFSDYSFRDTPSSPQFVLYALLSPEDASIWHGVGEYAGNEILRSYASLQTSFLNQTILRDLERPSAIKQSPIILNLEPGEMWKHPTYGNIDGGIGCVSDLSLFFGKEVKVSPLSVKLREQLPT
jgi:hypothetical protein